ncbi:protease [Actinobacillus equuli]|nr:protease [Actinobacillus equuli]
MIEQQGFSFISQALGTKAKAEDAVKLAGYEKVESIEHIQNNSQLNTIKSSSTSG